MLHLFAQISAGNIFYPGMSASNPADDGECQRNIVGAAKVKALPVLTKTIKTASALKYSSIEEYITKTKKKKIGKTIQKPAVWRTIELRANIYLSHVRGHIHLYMFVCCYACRFICAYLSNFNPLNFPMMTPLHFGRFYRRHRDTHTLTPTYMAIDSCCCYCIRMLFFPAYPDSHLLRCCCSCRCHVVYMAVSVSLFTVA